MALSFSRVQSLFATLALASAASGQTTYSWNVDASGNWGTASNWTATSGSGTTFPNAVGDAAVFGNAIFANRTVTLDAPFTVGSVTFNNSQFGFTVNAAVPANVLTLNNGT